MLPLTAGSQVRPITVVVVLLTALVILGGLLLIWELWPVVRWTLMAVFLAVALSPAVNWLQVHGLRRLWAILFVYLLLVLACVGVGLLLVPPLFAQVRDLVGFVVQQAQGPDGLVRFAEDLVHRHGLGGYAESLREQISGLPGQLGVAAGPLFTATWSLINGLAALISILLLSFFMLLDSDRFVAAGLELVAPAERHRLRRLLSRSADAIHGYVHGNLFISVIAGATAYLALVALDVSYAGALALVVAVFDLLPMVGAFIGAGSAILVALTVDPTKALILAAFFLIYQQIENHILQPVVYGRSIRLHPLFVFLAILAGGELLGIVGMLLAIPVAEIIRLLIAEWLARRTRKLAIRSTARTTMPRSTG
jgi:predicted PurR-regulated permease PerM